MKTIKNLFIIALAMFFFTSCGTLFTPTKQKITFVGLPETRIYDEGKRIGTTSEDGEAVIKVRKKLSDKTLVAKKEGYKNTYIELDAVFNPISIINLSNILAWAIDLGTGKCCKWDSEYIEFDMEKAE